MTDQSCHRLSRRSERGRTTVKLIGFLLLSLTMILIPIGTSFYLVFKYQTQQIEAPKQVWAEMPEPQTSLQSQLGLRLTWASPRPVIAPDWSGLVQTVSVAPGTEITNGTEIARINGIRRLAMLTTEPLFRPLSFDTQGSDVATLNTFLVSLGFPANDSDYFGGATATGVRMYAEAIGAPPTTDVFDPGWVIFLNEPIIAESVKMTAGAPVAMAGEEILTALPHLQSASFISAPSASRLLEADASAPAPLSDPLTLSEGAHVSVGEAALEIADGSTELTPQGVQALEPQLRTLAPATLAVLDEQLPSESWSIPSSSLFVDQTGGTCLVVRESGKPFSVSVTLLRTTESEVLVEGPLKKGYRLALNPKLESATCT